MKWPFVRREAHDALLKRVEELEGRLDSAMYLRRFTVFSMFADKIPATEAIEAVLTHLGLELKHESGQPAKWNVRKAQENPYLPDPLGAYRVAMKPKKAKK